MTKTGRAKTMTLATDIINYNYVCRKEKVTTKKICIQATSSSFKGLTHATCFMLYG